MIPNQVPSLNFDLGDTADMLRDSVQNFTADEIAPWATKIDRITNFCRASEVRRVVSADFHAPESRKIAKKHDGAVKLKRLLPDDITAVTDQVG